MDLYPGHEDVELTHGIGTLIIYVLNTLPMRQKLTTGKLVYDQLRECLIKKI